MINSVVLEVWFTAISSTLQLFSWLISLNVVSLCHRCWNPYCFLSKHVFPHYILSPKLHASVNLSKDLLTAIPPTRSMGVFHFNLLLSLYFFILSTVLLLCLSSTISVTNGNETDIRSLLEFKAKITRDPLGVLRSWNGTIHFCQWYGIRCGRRHHRGSGLDHWGDGSLHCGAQ